MRKPNATGLCIMEVLPLPTTFGAGGASSEAEGTTGIVSVGGMEARRRLERTWLMLSVSSLKVSVSWSVRDSFLRVSADDVVSAGAAEAFFSLMLFLSGSFRVFFLYCAILPAGLLCYGVNGESQGQGSACGRDICGAVSGNSPNAIPGMSSERRRQRTGARNGALWG